MDATQEDASSWSTAPVSVGIVYTGAAYWAVDRLLSSKYTQIHSILPRGASQSSVFSPPLPCNAKIEESEDTMEGGSFLSGRQTMYMILFLIQMVLLKINVDIVLVCLVY